jgi:energy-coupling factor transporter transmembrane protein EcfT
MFGMSVDPRIRAALGIIVLVVGVVLHQVVLSVIGGVLVLWAGGQWLQRSRSSRSTR